MPIENNDFPGMPWALRGQRQAQLARKYWFECQCKLCEGSFTGLEEEISVLANSQGSQAHLIQAMLHVEELENTGFQDYHSMMDLHKAVRSALEHQERLLHDDNLVLYRLRSLLVKLTKQLVTSSDARRKPTEDVPLMRVLLNSLQKMDSTAVRYAGEDNIMRFPIISTILILNMLCSSDPSTRHLLKACGVDVASCHTVERNLRWIHRSFLCQRSLCNITHAESVSRTGLMRCSRCANVRYCSRRW